MYRLALVSLFALLPACSSGSSDPLVEYPDLHDAGDSGSETGIDTGVEQDTGLADAPVETSSDVGPDGPDSSQLLSLPCFIDGVTRDNHLALTVNGDIMALPEGQLIPVTVMKYYESGYMEGSVRGRYLATWASYTTGYVPLTVWSKAAGTLELAKETVIGGFYADSDSDSLAYLIPDSDSLHRNVKASLNALTAGQTVISGLDTALVNAQCAHAIGFISSTEIVVAGCVKGSTQANVATYKIDGSGQSTIRLAGSAPGIWLSPDRSKLLAQTAKESSVISLDSSASPVSLDTPVVQGRFSSGGQALVYLRTDGELRRCEVSSPIVPITIGKAKSILGISTDAKQVIFATKEASDGTSDLQWDNANDSVLGVQQLAAAGGMLIGISTSGTQIIYTVQSEDPMVLGKSLYARSVSETTPELVTMHADHVMTDGRVIYWFEFSEATKSSALRAVRLSKPSEVIEIASGLNAITAHARVVGPHLFVASKDGLWRYPAVSP